MSISGLPAQFVLIDADTNDFPSDSNGVPALAVKDSENKVTVPTSQYRRNTSDIWEETKTAKTGTLQSGATGTGNGTDFDVEGYGSVKLQITGTFVATITFYHSVDGTNFVPMPVRDIYNGTRVFSTNLTGVYDMDGNSVKKIRAVISAYTSGSITVIGRAEGVSGHATFIEAKVTLQQVEGAIDSAVPTRAAFVGGKYSLADPSYHDGDLTPVRTNAKGEVLTQLTGSIESITSAPVVGVKTVTATAAEIFAGASVKSNRRKLILKNEDSVLRFRIGPSTVTQQNGFPVEPGAVIEVQFDPATAIPIYAISEGANLQVAVMEI